MVKTSPGMTALNAGEWAPSLGARIDLEGYGASCRELVNMIPMIQGPVRRRAGFRFVREVKHTGRETVLIPFQRSRSISYQIEFGDHYCRFYHDRGLLLSGGAPYEITSPYAAADLLDADGELQLDYTQSADVLYITHRSGRYPVQRLSRTSSATFAFAELTPDDGPYLAYHAGDVTMQPSARDGAIQITSSAPAWTPAHVGVLVRIEQESLTTPRWETDTAYAVGDFVRSEGSEYRAVTASGTSGASIPAHKRGTVSDGGVDWEYMASGYGVARITNYVDNQTVDADVLTPFPQSVVSAPSVIWTTGAWSPLAGYPETVAFWRERLVFGKGQRVDMSRTGDFESFAPDDQGEVLADSAISITLQSDEINDIVGLSPGRRLVVLTEGAEFAIGPLTTNQPFGPNNVDAPREATYGSRAVRPIRVGEALMHIAGSGRQLREIIDNLDIEGIVSRDMTVRAEHLGERRFAGMQRQREPYELLWLRRADGSLVALTYSRTQEVRAWARHEIGGGGKVNSLCVTGSPDGESQDLWAIIEREIDGQTRQYVEWKEAEHRPGDAQADAFYLDSGATYDGPPADEISGLDHLEGETVRILADGGAHPDRRVKNGAITLARPARKAQIGLPYTWRVATQRLEGGGQEGPSQGKTKRITDLTLRVDESLGGHAGPDAGNLDPIPGLQWRAPWTAMDTPEQLKSGDIHMGWPGGYDTDGYMVMQGDEPWPMTILGLWPQVQTNEQR